MFKWLRKLFKPKMFIYYELLNSSRGGVMRVHPRIISTYVVQKRQASCPDIVVHFDWVNVSPDFNTYVEAERWLVKKKIEILKIERDLKRLKNEPQGRYHGKV